MSGWAITISETSASASPPRAASISAGSQRPAPTPAVMARIASGRPWRTSGKSRKRRSGQRLRRCPRSNSRSSHPACQAARASRKARPHDRHTCDCPHRPLPARQILAIKHNSSFWFSERTPAFSPDRAVRPGFRFAKLRPNHKKLRPPMATGVLFGEQPDGGAGFLQTALSAARWRGSRAARGLGSSMGRAAAGADGTLHAGLRAGPAALRPAHPRRHCPTRRPASGSSLSRRRGPACRMRRLAPVPDRQAGPRLRPRSPRFSLASSKSPGLGDDERFGLLHAPFAPNCSSPDHSWKQTAHSPCNPRGVVIVQGFRGHFANASPPTDRICGGGTFAPAIKVLPLCSVVKQPATTTADFPRPTVCARQR